MKNKIPILIQYLLRHVKELIKIDSAERVLAKRPLLLLLRCIDWVNIRLQIHNMTNCNGVISINE